MNKELKEQVHKEFDLLTEDIVLDNPVCCERHDCLCSKITQRESIHDFIDYLIDKTVQMTEERIAEEIIKEIDEANWSMRLSTTSRLKTFIKQAITNKSDINN